MSKFQDYVCKNAGTACYLVTGKVYRLRAVRNGWLETVEGDRFAQFRFDLVKK